MIKRAYSAEELSLLPQKGVEAQKIRALLLAYGVKYDFCRFYVSENATFCAIDGSFVVCEHDKSKSADICEIAEFFAFNGFSEIFCSERIGEPLSKRLRGAFRRVNLMRFRGTPRECPEVEKEPPLTSVYEILKASFDIEYEPWYADMSHRIRHGVSKARKLGSTALIIQHDINGEALLSQIATLPEKRGHGGASRLILSVCGELAESSVYIVCEDALIPFYGKLGFEKVSDKYLITKKPKTLTVI